MQWLLAVFFVAAGILHFVVPAVYLKIMPPYLPWPLALVYASGLAEIGLGLLVLVPGWSSSAAWALIVLLVAIFPANLHMAINSHLFPQFSPILLWLRLPLQAVFIWWAYWFTRGERIARVAKVQERELKPWSND